MVSATDMVVLASAMATRRGITSMVIMTTIRHGIPPIITTRIIPPGGHITDTATTIIIPMTTGMTAMQAMITMIAVAVMMYMRIPMTVVAGMVIQTDITQHLSVDMYL